MNSHFKCPKAMAVTHIVIDLEDQFYCFHRVSFFFQGFKTNFTAYVMHRIPDEFPQNVQPEMWLTQLHKELETQGITLPER